MPTVAEFVARGLRAARRPALLAGLGLHDDAEARALTAFTEALGAPVFTTYRPRACPGGSPPGVRGRHAFTAKTEGELAEAFRAALAARAPVLLGIRIDPSGYRQILEAIRVAPR